MFISKRKLIEVLADSIAVCNKNAIRATNNKTNSEKRRTQYCEIQRSISFEISDIAFRLGILNEVMDRRNKIVTKWEKEEEKRNRKIKAQQKRMME